MQNNADIRFSIASNKTYLSTTYAEKEQAKALGARWDNKAQSWYVPAGLDLDKFSKWLITDQQPQYRQKQQAPSNAIQPNNRIYLYTKPSDNPAIQELKASGIVKLDMAHKLWYADKSNPSHLDAIRQWTTRPNIPTPAEHFTHFLQNHGIQVTAGHPKEGSNHRLANEGSTDKNVIYNYYPNQQVPAGFVKNFLKSADLTWVYPAEYLNALQNIEAVDRANSGQAPIQHTDTHAQPPTHHHIKRKIG